MPAPLLFALHLAAQTRRIRLGTAIICLNLHHPVAIAEQVAVADLLTKGRMAVGFGSGSTPEEFGLFDLAVTDDQERHQRFEDALKLMREFWLDDRSGAGKTVGYVSGSPGSRRLPFLPTSSADLPARCWLAVNSQGSARIAGTLNFNMLFSHLRTPEQYRQYCDTYRAAGGTGLVAANRPVFVGRDDESAFEVGLPAVRIVWRRFQKEGKIAASLREPTRPEELCAHPLNFIVGGPKSVARQLQELHATVPFDVANVEVRWAGLSHQAVCESLSRLMADAMPMFAD
jgi:alkanesulfonate monooxygenase SsuD/methylene tetrahydromethanopterin reductase-like flavin-dependent oxidoreductase (luciferase family)